MPQSPDLFFQWQNEFLRRTIYPLRELKLCDFLVYEYEIETWAEYKTKTLAHIPDEVQAYETEQARQRQEAYQDYTRLKAYFESENIRPAFQARYPQPDPGELDTLVWMHRAFARYFSAYKNVHKERVFVAVRLQEMELRQKEYMKEVAEIQRKLRNMGPAWKHTPRYTLRLEQLQTVTLSMLEEEYARLSAFQAALLKLEKRRKDLLAWQADLVKKQGELRYLLNRKKSELAALEVRLSQNPGSAVQMQVDQARQDRDRLSEALHTVERMLALPEAEQMEVASVVPAATLPDIVRARTAAYRASLNLLDHTQLLERVVRRFIEQPAHYPLWLQYMVIHFSGMRYQSAHGSWADPRDMLVALTEKAVENGIQALDERAVETLCIEKLSCYEKPAPPPGPALLPEQECRIPPLALADDRRWKARAQEHLRRIQSHRLRVRVIPGSGKTSAPLYTLVGGELSVTTENAPKGLELFVELASLPGEPQPVDAYLVKAYPGHPQRAGMYLLDRDAAILPNPYKRKSLSDLCVAEEHYVIEELLTDDQVMADLAGISSRLQIPAWMWHEIVRLTHLRTTHVGDEHWESLSPQEIEQYWAYRDRAYRVLLEKWKAANLVGWREEHDRTSQLVVSRAVCNEVAEHILHLRGHSPAGGLTARPPFYMKKERDPKFNAAATPPFFVKARSTKHFIPGASLLWLRFVEGRPNQWRIALPLTLRSGETLLTPDVEVSRGGDDEDHRLNHDRVGVVKAASTWRYYQTPGGALKRDRTVTNREDERFRQDEWLRWMHEATIVKVAETVDGPTVLTFETALPYEDRRRSTIGVFKHSAYDLLYAITPSYVNGSFLGYVPDQAPPVQDLRPMLDWDKVMRQPGYLSASQAEAYWRDALAALPPAVQPRGFGVLSGPSLRSGERDLAAAAPAFEGVEAAPPLEDLRPGMPDAIPCFEIDPLSGRVVPFQPELEVLRITLPRGARLQVEKSAALSTASAAPGPSEAGSAAGSLYYPIRQSHDVPHAQDLYVRADHVVDAPPEQADLPARLVSAANAYRLTGAGPGGGPHFTPALDPHGQTYHIPQDTALLLSGVHAASPLDTGDGRVHSADGSAYYLVVEYPYQPGLRGCFIPAAAVEPIDLDAYLRSAIQGLSGEAQLDVVVAPRMGQAPAALRETPGGSALVGGQPVSLPAGARLTVSAMPYFTPGDAFYRITACPPAAAAAGLYIHTEDVVLYEKIEE